jgi:oxygen-dependent protoporphyrinogen oxidase
LVTEPTRAIEHPEAIVVGAGVAGLVVARELALQGHRVRVLEASNRPGGQVSSTELAGLRIDTGAEAFATRGALVSDYLAQLGLVDRIVAPRDAPAWLHGSTGKTLPLPAVSLLGIPSSPLAADVVSVVGRLAAWRGKLDVFLPGSVGATAPTVGALVRRRMGNGILEKLVAPVVEGIHSKHPDLLPVDAVPGLVQNLLREKSLSRAVARMRIDSPAGSLVASLDGGMVALVDTLLFELHRCGVAIEYGVRVAEVHPDHVVLELGSGGDIGAQGATDQGATGQPEKRHGIVVVAAPGLISPVDGSSASQTATHLAILVLAADSEGAAPLAGAPRGSGVLVARGTPVVARALTHMTAKWSTLRAAAVGREIVRLSYEQPPTREQAQRDAEVLLGVSIPNERIIAAETVTWLRAGRVAVDGSIPVVGEQVAGTGLAAVISHACSVAQQIGPPKGDLQAGSNTHTGSATQSGHAARAA